MSSLRKQAVSGVRWTTVSAVAGGGVQFLQLALLARLLAPEDFGLMAMVLVVLGFGQAYVDMGLSKAIIHRQDVTREQLSSLYWVNLAAGTAVFLLVFGAAPLVARFYGEPRLGSLLAWAALAFLVTPFGQQYHTLLEKELRFGQLALADVVSAVVGLLVSVFLAYRGAGVYALVVGQLASAGVRSGLLVGVGWREWRPALHFRRDDLRGYLGFGLFQMGERSVNYLAANMDKLLIGSLLGVGPLGYYNVAAQLMVRPFQLLSPVLTRVALPVFARMQNDHLRMREGYLQVLRATSLVVFPIYMGMAVLARPLVTLLLGSEWLPVVPVFQVLTILGFLWSLGNPLGSLLLAKGRADLGFYVNVVALVIYTIAILVGARVGLTGVAWGMVLAAGGVLFPLEFWIRWRLVELRPAEYLRSFLPALAGAGVMGGALLLLRRLFTAGGDLEWLLGGSAIGAVLYLALMVRWQRGPMGQLWSLVR